MICIKLSLSLKHYESKESIDIKKLRFKRTSINIDNFVKYIKEGYCFCHWFNTKAETFSISEKRNENFERANVVFVDVDDFNIEMKQFVDGLSMKPTLYYTTPSNLNPAKGNKYRFRLCYVFKEDILNCDMLASTYKSIIKAIRKDYPDYPDKDNCGGRVAQYMNGNGTGNCEAYSTESVFALDDFGVSLVESPQDKSVAVKVTPHNNTESVFPITDTDFISDLFRMQPSELLAKYRGKYNSFDHTELSFVDGYALVPDGYQEIYRRWYQEIRDGKNGNTYKVSVVKKLKDGDNRRKCLYIAALIRRKIMPTISFENLLYNLVCEREWYYDNSDNVLSNQELMKIANNALKTDYDNINVKSKRKTSKFKVDKSYCLEHNIKPKAMVGIVRRKLKDEEIGNLYDCNLSVRENLQLLKADGYKISQSRLYEFCDRNGIPRRSYKKVAV